MQSMTGYGRARACRDGREITIELKTVNHRFLDLSFRMPKNLTFLEDMLRERINKSALKRGHVDVFVTYANTRADAQFLRRALRGEDIVLKSDGAQLRSYCYVADAVRGLLAALISGARGEAYNVAARGEAHTIREFAETLARLAGVRVTFERPPEAEKRGYSPVSRAVQDAGKLEAFGWSARVPLEEGLSRTLRILREAGARA